MFNFNPLSRAEARDEMLAEMLYGKKQYWDDERWKKYLEMQLRTYNSFFGSDGELSYTEFIELQLINLLAEKAQADKQKCEGCGTLGELKEWKGKYYCPECYEKERLRDETFREFWEDDEKALDQAWDKMQRVTEEE